MRKEARTQLKGYILQESSEEMTVVAMATVRRVEINQPQTNITLCSNPTVFMIDSFSTKILLKHFYFLKTLELSSLNKRPYFLFHKEYRRHQRKYIFQNSNMPTCIYPYPSSFFCN